jgi:hypothetical protein
VKRKHISWKTKCASSLIAPCRNCGYVPFYYDDAKKMTEDQLLSLFHFDHNILHETGDPDVDKFWNLAPMLIMAHREKTKQDAKVIAKGRRIRKRHSLVEIGHMLAVAVDEERASPSEAVAEALTEGFVRGIEHQKRASISPSMKLLKLGERELRKRKLQSRGFDKTRRRKMDGTVVKR